MTAVFVGYFRPVAPEQAASIEPDGGRAKRPGTVIGAEGSSKLVARVKSVAGGSGYVSSHFTLRESLTAIALQNKQGEYVEPSLGTFKAVIIAGGLFKNGLEPTPLLNLDGVGSLAHRHRHLCVGAPQAQVPSARESHAQLFLPLFLDGRSGGGWHRVRATAHRHPGPNGCAADKLQDGNRRPTPVM